MKEVLGYILMCAIAFIVIFFGTIIRLYYYKQNFKLLKWFCLFAIVLMILGGIKIFVLEK